MILDDKVSLREAYLIMYLFTSRYWERGNKSDDLTDFIIDLGPVREDETTDPAQIRDWLKAAEFVLSHPEYNWADYGELDCIGH